MSDIEGLSTDASMLGGSIRPQKPATNEKESWTLDDGAALFEQTYDAKTLLLEQHGEVAQFDPNIVVDGNVVTEPVDSIDYEPDNYLNVKADLLREDSGLALGPVFKVTQDEDESTIAGGAFLEIASPEATVAVEAYAGTTVDTLNDVPGYDFFRLQGDLALRVSDAFTINGGVSVEKEGDTVSRGFSGGFELETEGLGFALAASYAWNENPNYSYAEVELESQLALNISDAVALALSGSLEITRYPDYDYRTYERMLEGRLSVATGGRERLNFSAGAVNDAYQNGKEGESLWTPQAGIGYSTANRDYGLTFKIGDEETILEAEYRRNF